MAIFTVEGLGNATTPIENGTYQARVDAVTEHESRSGEHRYFKFRLALTEDGPFQGRSLFDYHTYTIRPGLESLERALKAVNVEMEGGEFDTDEVIGSELLVTVTQKKDKEGEMRAEITRYMSL